MSAIGGGNRKCGVRPAGYDKSNVDAWFAVPKPNRSTAFGSGLRCSQRRAEIAFGDRTGGGATPPCRSGPAAPIAPVTAPTVTSHVSHRYPSCPCGRLDYLDRTAPGELEV